MVFVVHSEKSVFVPSQEIEYLGFIINSVTMTVTLTTKKKRKIFDICQEVSNTAVHCINNMEICRSGKGM